LLLQLTKNGLELAMAGICCLLPAACCPLPDVFFLLPAVCGLRCFCYLLSRSAFELLVGQTWTKPSVASLCRIA
jgi:hypothetical protein